MVQGFSIGETIPDEVNDLKIYSTDFVQEEEFSYSAASKSMSGNFSMANGGYIEIYRAGQSKEDGQVLGSEGIKTVYIYNDEYFKVAYGNSDSVPEEIKTTKAEILYFKDRNGNAVYTTTDTNIYSSYVWKGNDDYTIAVVYQCKNGNEVNIIKDIMHVSMAGSCDFYIGDTDCTGKRLKEAGFSVTEHKWYDVAENVHDDERLRNLTPKEEWALRKGLTYSGSLFNRDGGKIVVGLVNAVPPTNVRVMGDGEMVLDDSENSFTYITSGPLTDAQAAQSGYTVSLDNIQCPSVIKATTYLGEVLQTNTGNMEYMESFGFVFQGSKTKHDYNFLYSDSSSNGINSDSIEDIGGSDSGSGGEGGGGSEGGGEGGGSTPVTPPVKPKYTITIAGEDKDKITFTKILHNKTAYTALPTEVTSTDSLEVVFKAKLGYKLNEKKTDVTMGGNNVDLTFTTGDEITAAFAIDRIIGNVIINAKVRFAPIIIPPTGSTDLDI